MEKTPSAKQAVRVYCAQNGITQTRLAVDLGITPSTFSEVLSGLRKPTDEQVEKLRDRTGIDLREFAGAA